jgi:hypothetical protein
VIVLNINCANDVYHRKSKSKSITQKSYSLADSLVVKNYGLYNSREEVLLVPNKKPFEVNKDSLVLVFQASLNRVGLQNLKIDIGENLIDSSLNERSVVRSKHIDNSYLKRIAGITDSLTVFLPLIIVNNQFQFTASFTSGGGFNDNGWNAITWLNLMVYVMKEQKVIYSRHIRYKSEIIWADTKSEILAVPPLAAVKQEHWDELVRLAMEDYIKRLK